MQYKNKKQYRLKNFDYAASGYYFVTICAKDRKCSFGKIIESRVQLHTIGRIIEKCWLEIPEHFVYILLDEFIIMPNHIHGIIVINDGKNEFIDPSKTIEKGLRRNVACYVPTEGNKNNKIYFSDIAPKKGSLGAIVRSFKSAVMRECNKKGLSFKWQERFYDRIIRNEESLDKIREYIRINPAKWDFDKNNPLNFTY